MKLNRTKIQLRANPKTPMHLNARRAQTKWTMAGQFSGIFSLRINIAEPVHPTAGAFHHPPMGLEPFPTLDGPRLFTAGANARRATQLQRQVPDVVEIAVLLQAQPLPAPRPRFRPLHGRVLARAASAGFLSCRLAPSTAMPMGIPVPSRGKLRLTPPLAPSVGFGPVFFPAQRRLRHRPIPRPPLEPLQFVIFLEPQRPRLAEHAFLTPLLNRCWSPEETGEVKLMKSCEVIPEDLEMALEGLKEFAKPYLTLMPA